ncbi:ATP-binding cassette domain-containing protein [Patescibacteria group bacterium]|nr:ATP-binding cassette domain-containing protein [Patescibacteria group bacterium]
MHFTYKESQKETKTLQNISFTMGVGEKIALVGESGSGKSTFLSLLRGLYDVDAVQVDVDNKQYDNLHVLANNTSLIPQEPEIFEETMLYNIAV